MQIKFKLASRWQSQMKMSALPIGKSLWVSCGYTLELFVYLLVIGQGWYVIDELTGLGGSIRVRQSDV